MVKRNIKTTKKQVEQACEFIRSQITSGEISTDGKIPAVRKLGEQTGFQRNTIWRALLQLKEERFVVSSPNGRYQVHPRFKLNKKGSKKLNIAFAARGEDKISSTFIQMVYDCLSENQNGFNVELKLFLESVNKPIPLRELNKFDAAILCTGAGFQKYDSLRKKEIYATGLTAPYFFNLPCNVRIDNFDGGETAGKIFAKSKIREAVLLGESSTYPEGWHADFELRVLGFRKKWLQAGRMSSEISEYPLPVDLKKRQKKIEEIVSRNDGLTGYFALSDSTGTKLLSTLKENGIKVPGEAMVIGFDDNPESKEAELSSLHPDPYEIAEKLILQLRTQESEPGYTEVLYVKPSFIERKSSKKK